MKTALCFSCLPRYLEEGYKLFKKNLVGFEEMDIYVHSWSTSTYLGNNENLSRKDTTDRILELYNVKDYIFEDQKYDIGPQEAPKEFVHYSMFYSIMKSNELKSKFEEENNFKYDCVIRCRFDVALLDELNVKNYNLSKVYSPFIHQHSGKISDWINFSNSKIMDIYSNLYNNLELYRKNNIRMTAGEDLISAHLNHNNIEYASSDNNIKLIRTHAIANTWINVSDL